MSSSNNIILLDGCVQEYITQNELSHPKDEVFEIFSLAQITKKLELSYDEMLNSIVDGGKDGGIDVFLIALDDKIIQTSDDIDIDLFSSSSKLKIVIGQAKIETKFTEVVLDKIITSLPFIYNLELDEDKLLVRFNPSLTDKIKIFHSCWEKAISKNSQIEVLFYYSTRANEKRLKGTFTPKIEQIKALTSSHIHNVTVNFEVYSAEELLNLFRTPKNTTFTILLKEHPLPIEYGENKFGYIGVSKLKDFFDFLTDEDDQLLEGIFEHNIRHFQGNVDVNKKIKKTIEEDYNRDFWWLNNGVTIISSSVRPLGKKLMLDNPQIVNGLQTSFTLYHAYKKNDIDDRSILIKIIESNDKETIDKVISSTNSQNPVSPTLLRATEDLQRNIELFFLTKGYYYDRRKNYYKNQGKPALKIFNIQTTAQAIEAIKNWMPSSARSKPTTLIKTDASYAQIFNIETDFTVYLQCSLIVQTSQKYIAQLPDKDRKGLLRNYTYHIARIAMSLYASDAYYSTKNIIDVEIGLFNYDLFIKAVDLLLDTINSYQVKNPTENIINISKSKSFSDYLSKALITKFTKPNL